MKLKPTTIQIVAGIVLVITGFFVVKNLLGQNAFSEFGTYANAVAAIVSAALMYKANGIALRINKEQTKPEVTFSLHEPPVLHPDKFIDSVKIINKTAVPVNNILVRFKMNRNEEYSRWVSCFSLRGDESQELFWMRYPDTIQAAYHDLSGKRYFLFTYQDSTSHEMANEITAEQYRGISQQGIANRNNNNVQLRDRFTQFILTSLPLKRGIMDDVMTGYREFVTILLF